MKKFIVILLLSIFSFQLYSQQRLKGYQVIFDSYGKHVFPVTYKRTTYSGSGLYLTVYDIYNVKGKHIIEINAKHQKNIKKVTVEVKIPNGGVFSLINTEEGEYDEPSLEPFGNQGNYRILGGDDYPPQLSLKFISSKFETVKVISVNATRPSTQTFVFYVLAKEL